MECLFYWGEVLMGKSFKLGIASLLIVFSFQNCSRDFTGEESNLNSTGNIVSDESFPIVHSQVFHNHLWEMAGHVKFEKSDAQTSKNALVGQLSLSVQEDQLPIVGGFIFVSALVSGDGDIDVEGYPCPANQVNSDGTRYLFCSSYEDKDSKLFKCNSMSNPTDCQFSFPISDIIRSGKILSLKIGFLTDEPRDNGAETPESLEVELRGFLE